MKKNFKRDYKGLNINALTVISMIAVIASGAVFAYFVYRGDIGAVHNWFFAFAGVCLLGIGLIVYLGGAIESSALCNLLGSLFLAAGCAWLVADVIYDGRGGVGSGWWIGLAAGAGFGLMCYFVSALINRRR